MRSILYDSDYEDNKTKRKKHFSSEYKNDTFSDKDNEFSYDKVLLMPINEYESGISSNASSTHEQSVLKNDYDSISSQNYGLCQDDDYTNSAIDTGHNSFLPTEGDSPLINSNLSPYSMTCNKENTSGLIPGISITKDNSTKTTDFHLEHQNSIMENLFEEGIISDVHFAVDPVTKDIIINNRFVLNYDSIHNEYYFASSHLTLLKSQKHNKNALKRQRTNLTDTWKKTIYHELETFIKMYPKKTINELAARVYKNHIHDAEFKGKTQKQCVDMIVFLRQRIKNKKQ